MTVDLNRAGMLLHIVSKAKDWPNLKGIHDIAMAELEDMSKHAAQDLAEIRADEKARADEEAAKVAAAAEAKRQKAADELKAQEEAQAKAAEQAKQAPKPKLDPVPVGAQSATESDAARRL